MNEYLETLARKKSMHLEEIVVIEDPARMFLYQYEKMSQRVRRHSMNISISRWNSVVEERIQPSRSISLPIDVSPRRPARQDSLRDFGQQRFSYVDTGAPKRPLRQESVKRLLSEAQMPMIVEEVEKNSSSHTK